MDIIDEIRRREGDEYTNRPADRGGPTKYGITVETLAEWRRRSVTAADVAALTWAEARQIYHQRYIVGPGFDRIEHKALRDLVIDSGVNCGVRAAAKWLQESANELGAELRPDGIYGHQSQAQISRLIAAGRAWRLTKEVLIRRVLHYGRIIATDARRRGRSEDQALNALGWLTRAMEYLDETGPGDDAQAGIVEKENASCGI